MSTAPATRDLAYAGETPPEVWARLTSLPNMVTMGRTVVSVPLALYAAAYASGTVLVIAFAVYWIGDIADGALARWLGKETRIGAVLDIIADRACTGSCAVALIAIRPEFWLPVAIFLVSFMVVDCALSLSFLLWPIKSPNYFDRVSPRLHRLNWSPVAKASNSAAVVLSVALGYAAIATVIAVCLLALKVSCSLRVTQLVPGVLGDADR